MRGGRTDGRTDGKRKPEKIALCGIIGHRPLRGRCPKKRKKDPVYYHAHYRPVDIDLKHLCFYIDQQTLFSMTKDDRSVFWHQQLLINIDYCDCFGLV